MVLETIGTMPPFNERVSRHINERINRLFVQEKKNGMGMKLGVFKIIKMYKRVRVCVLRSYNVRTAKSGTNSLSERVVYLFLNVDLAWDTHTCKHSR